MRCALRSSDGEAEGRWGQQQRRSLLWAAAPADASAVRCSAVRCGAAMYGAVLCALLCNASLLGAMAPIGSQQQRRSLLGGQRPLQRSAVRCNAELCGAVASALLVHCCAVVQWHCAPLRDAVHFCVAGTVRRCAVMGGAARLYAVLLALCGAVVLCGAARCWLRFAALTVRCSAALCKAVQCGAVRLCGAVR